MQEVNGPTGKTVRPYPKSENRCTRNCAPPRAEHRKVSALKKAIRIYKCLIKPRWEYGMHLTSWTPAISSGVEEVERLFSRQVFGGIGRNRAKGLRLLCRIQSAENRIEILALRMLARAREQKKKILAQPRQDRNMTELQWISRDIAAMLRKVQFREALGHL